MNTVLSIAQKVRTWTEQKEIKVNPSKPDLKLTGWCAIASCHLFRQLANAGIKSEIHLYEGKDYSHAFIVVDDHVVDVTATQFRQFRKTPVVIIHQKEAEQYEFYNSDMIFQFPAKLRDHQLKEGWPNNQIAMTR